MDTDVYVLPSLSNYYKVHWYIVYSSIIPFEERINKVGNQNLTIHFVKLPNASMLSAKMARTYNNMISDIIARKPAFIYSAIINIPCMFIAALRYPLKKTMIAAHNVTTPRGVKHYYLAKFYSDTCFRIFKNFHTFSRSQYELMKSRFPKNNVFFAPFVIKDYGHTQRLPGEVITFLMYGRLRGYKRPETVIKAAEILRTLTPIPFKVIIAGECDDWPKYASLIQHKELFDLRIYSIPNEDVPDLFGETHYTLLPYRDIAQSGVLFVGINYAKPAILTRLPAFEEVLTDNDNALFIENSGETELAQKMKYVLENHSCLYPSLKGNLEKLRDTTFNKEVIIEQYKGFIDSVING